MTERAGFCTVCNRSVYLTAEGGCVFGHGPEAIKGESHTVKWEIIDAMGNPVPRSGSGETADTNPSTSDIE